MVEAKTFQPTNKNRTRVTARTNSASVDVTDKVDAEPPIHNPVPNPIELLWAAPPESPSLDHNHVHIWAARLDLPPAELAELSATLAPLERERAHRFRLARHRDRFIAGRALLRAVLSRYLGLDPAKIEFNYETNGKPALAAEFARSGLQFNLSHCEDLALIAVTRDCSVGVDVERIRRMADADQLVARFFSAREAAGFGRLSESEKPTAFFNLWTRKEAWLKAIGEGIGYSLNRVEVSFLPGEPARLIRLPENQTEAANWNLEALTPAVGFAAAVAIAGPKQKISCWRYTPELRSPRLNQFRQPIAILGVPFDNVTVDETLRLIEQMVASSQPHYLVTANVDFLVQARRDVELRHILFDAHLVLCDGTPLLWASRLLGNPLPERVAGADLVPLLIKIAAQKGYRLFFLGATPESAEHAVANLQRQYPQLVIAGHYSPPFRPLLEMDHDEIKRRILQAKPDVLFVSFGCPKQEKWIAMHYRALGVPVAVGVGATIDFLAGEVKRAPLWMQHSGTEWLFRLAQEPRRLFRRYLNDLGVFGVSILRQWWRLQFRSTKGLANAEQQTSNIELRTSNIGHRTSNAEPGTSLVISIPERLDLEAVHDGSFLPTELLNDRRHCLLDMSAVSFIDSSGVGLLIRLQKQLRQSRRELVLLSPSQAATRALALMRLQDFFAAAPDVISAEQLLAARANEQAAAVTLSETRPNPLEWRGEITADNAEEVWHSTLAHFSESRASDWIIDLSAVRFIDSSGLGLMVKARKHARKLGHSLTFTGIQPLVKNVLHLAHLEEFLLGTKRA